MADEVRRAIPALGREQNSELALIALLTCAIDALPESTSADELQVLAAELRQIVNAPPTAAREALGRLIDSAQDDAVACRVLDDPRCHSLLATLVDNYILFAVLAPEGPARRILKYSYADEEPELAKPRWRDRLRPQELLGRLRAPDGKQFIAECPMGWRARSFHIEIALPQELRASYAGLFDFRTDEFVGRTNEDVNRVSLYSDGGLTEDQDVSAFVEVTPERAGRIAQAAGVSTVIASLLWLGVASGLDAANPAPAVSLLLAGAALFSGLAALQGQHILVRKIFAVSRRWLFVAAVAALAGSATLALELFSAQPVTEWVCAAVIATVACLRLVWSAIRAPR